MNVTFLIAEGCSLANCGWAFSRLYLRYRGIQALLWPVTLTVRAVAGDPLRDPEPLQLKSPEEIRALEKELGIIGDTPEEAAHKALDAAHRRWQATGGREAHEELVARQTAYERLQQPAGPQGPTGPQGPDAPVAPRGRSRARTRLTPRGQSEMYRLLRKGLRQAQDSGETERISRAKRHLLEFSMHYHNEREGRFFPHADHPDYQPWTDEDDRLDQWFDAFGGFQ